MICYSCNKILDLPTKISFRTSCPHCGKDLHSCMGCEYYSPGKPNDCLVPGTEFVKDRERNNLCEDFQVRKKPSSSTPKKDAKNRFDSLFKNEN